MSRVKGDSDDLHILRMTDDTGMFQHAVYGIPDLTKGYTTDDNARALIMAVKFYEANGRPIHLTLLVRYLAFVLYAQNEAGCFRNFMTYERRFTELQGSEECFGRCLWALATTLASKEIPEGVKDACLVAFKRALPNVDSLHSLRGRAYAIIGLELMEDAMFNQRILGLAESIAKQFEESAGNKWRWFEDRLTYDNALLPWSMFMAFQRTGQERFYRIAHEGLKFLDEETFKNGYFCPIGCKGWWIRGGTPALYDQQPIEASMSVLAHIAAYQIAGDSKFLVLAQMSMDWYIGKNSLGESLVDDETGACFDGVTADGINCNQGAESVVGYHIARLALLDCQ